MNLSRPVHRSPRGGRREKERAAGEIRLDALYGADGLRSPHIDASVLCRWESGDRRPSDERTEYFCRLYLSNYLTGEVAAYISLSAMDMSATAHESPPSRTTPDAAKASPGRSMRRATR